MTEVTVSAKERIAGWALSGLPVLFFLVDGVMKLFKPAIVVETTLKLGYPESTITGIGLTLLVCTVLYTVPRTAMLGAALLTGYLGGAVATHVRVEAGLFNILFPVIVGVLVWAGLWLRNPRLRALFPLQSNTM